MMDNSTDRERCDDHPQSLFQNGCGFSPMITITVTPTTGGQFNLEMVKNDTIENLKKIVSKKLKVSRERICLLYRERQLKKGTLEENEIIDGCRLTLLPIVETGLTAQKPELSVMNALESLNEAQVNDFLSGKAPLNLTMRLGDHMMLIQLMLSTFSNQSHASSSSGNAASSNPSSSRAKFSEEVSKSILVDTAATGVSIEEPSSSTNRKSAQEPSTFCQPANISTRLEKILSLSSPSSSSSSSGTTAAHCASKPTNVRKQQQHHQQEIDRDDSQTGTRLGLNTATAGAGVATSSTTNSETIAAAMVSRLTPNVVVDSNIEPRTSDFECKRTSVSGSDGSEYATSSCTCASCPRLLSNTSAAPITTTTSSASCTLDSVALSEATRNLTQTLKKLSSEVLTSKRAISVPQKYKGFRSNVMHYKRKPNAIIENMEHHGRGIYSGTFSGTLNPALQDRHGRPKKDVSTIIHILNDLLCAGPKPHCRKSSCACNNGASTSNTESTPSSMMVDSPSTLFDAVNKEQTNSTAQVPVPFTIVSATPQSDEIVSKNNENQTTRNKMKQLKTIMEERKEKRKAKRFSPYEKQFSCVDLISSQNMDSSEPWPDTSSETAASSIHPTKANESIEPDPSPSIHSEPVIA